MLILCVVLGTPHPPKQVGRTALWWAAESGKAETLAVVLGLVLSKLEGDARDACLVAVDGHYKRNFLQNAAWKGALGDPKLVAQIEALPPITLATLLSAQDTASRRDPAAPAVRSPASCWWCCGGWWWWYGVTAYFGSPACRVGLLSVPRMLRPPAPTVQPRSQPDMLLWLTASCSHAHIWESGACHHTPQPRCAWRVPRAARRSALCKTLAGLGAGTC